MWLGIGTPSGTGSMHPLHLTYAASRRSGTVYGYILTRDHPLRQHRLILCCRIYEDVASPMPWRLSFNGCAPWFPGVARIHASDTHAQRYRYWRIDEADERLLDFILDMPLKHFRKIIEWGYLPANIANAYFNEKLTEYNLLLEHFKTPYKNQPILF